MVPASLLLLLRMLIFGLMGSNLRDNPVQSFKESTCFHRNAKVMVSVMHMVTQKECVTCLQRHVGY